MPEQSLSSMTWRPRIPYVSFLEHFLTSPPSNRHPVGNDSKPCCPFPVISCSARSPPGPQEKQQGLPTAFCAKDPTSKDPTTPPIHPTSDLKETRLKTYTFCWQLLHLSH